MHPINAVDEYAVNVRYRQAEPREQSLKEASRKPCSVSPGGSRLEGRLDNGITVAPSVQIVVEKSILSL